MESLSGSDADALNENCVSPMMPNPGAKFSVLMTGAWFDGNVVGAVKVLAWPESGAGVFRPQAATDATRTAERTRAFRVTTASTFVPLSVKGGSGPCFVTAPMHGHHGPAASAEPLKRGWRISSMWRAAHASHRRARAAESQAEGVPTAWSS